jgi:hypothetical protein
MSSFHAITFMQEWIKGRRDIILTMPLWTRSETEVLWKALYADKVGPMRLSLAITPNRTAVSLRHQ